MAFFVPDSSSVLFDRLKFMYTNKTHIRMFKVNSADCCVLVDLDWTANQLGGVADFSIPIKRTFVNEARDLVNVLLRNFENGTPPSEGQSANLYGMVDSSRH